jgi:hypothetical protein
VDRPALDRHAAGQRRPVDGVRMLSVVLRCILLAVVSDRLEEVAFEEPERAGVGLAEPPGRLGHLVEDRLEPRAAGDFPENAADRALLLANVCELTRELGLVGNRSFDLPSLRTRALVA